MRQASDFITIWDVKQRFQLNKELDSLSTKATTTASTLLKRRMTDVQKKSEQCPKIHWHELNWCLLSKAIKHRHRQSALYDCFHKGAVIWCFRANINPHFHTSTTKVTLPFHWYSPPPLDTSWHLQRNLLPLKKTILIHSPPTQVEQGRVVRNNLVIDTAIFILWYLMMELELFLLASE